MQLSVSAHEPAPPGGAARGTARAQKRNHADPEDEMLEIEKWSKEETHNVMMELLYSFNYMWFLMEGWVAANFPEKRESEAFMKLGEQFGAYQAKRLEKTISEPVSGIDRVAAFLKRSHWTAFEDIRLDKRSEKELRMRTVGCTTQKAARKWGMAYYACGDAGLRLRSGFATRVDSTATVRRVFTPPDQRPSDVPEDVSCEWIITIE